MREQYQQHLGNSNDIGSAIDNTNRLWGGFSLQTRVNAYKYWIKG